MVNMITGDVLVQFELNIYIYEVKASPLAQSREKVGGFSDSSV